MRYLAILFVCFFCLTAFSQTEFFDGSYQEALRQAKEQEKRVILLFDSPGCAPCKKLEQVFFSDPKTGEFLNRHFVVRKTTAIVRVKDQKNVYEDTPDGRLAEQYEVNGFPSLVILDADSLSAPQKIAKLEGLFLTESVTKEKAYEGKGFPTTMKFEFMVEEIRQMFEKYVRVQRKG